MNLQQKAAERQARKRFNRGVWVRRGIAIACGVLLVAGGLLFFYRGFVNARFVKNVRNGIYGETAEEEGLLTLNVIEPEVVYYNLGVDAYRGENYKDAEYYFTLALRTNPTHASFDDDACDIRINLALSILYQIDLERIEQEKFLEELARARAVLTEDGCANPEKGIFDGHSEDAERLKYEIDKLMEAASGGGGGGEEESEGGGGGEDEQQSSGGENGQNSSHLPDPEIVQPSPSEPGGFSGGGGNGTSIYW